MGKGNSLDLLPGADAGSMTDTGWSFVCAKKLWSWGGLEIAPAVHMFCHSFNLQGLMSCRSAHDLPMTSCCNTRNACKSSWPVFPSSSQASWCAAWYLVSFDFGTIPCIPLICWKWTCSASLRYFHTTCNRIRPGPYLAWTCTILRDIASHSSLVNRAYVRQQYRHAYDWIGPTSSCARLFGPPTPPLALL